MSMRDRRIAGFESAIRADLIQRRWLHVHAFLLGAVCFLCSWMLAAGLMRAGVERLSLRWALALAATYVIYLGLLRLWCGWLLSRDAGDGSLDGIDSFVSGPGGGPAPDASADPGTPPITSGGGGDFGGAGASASFDAGEAGTGAGEIAQGVVEAAASADEGIVVVVPLAIVIGVAAMIAGALGFAVFGLFGVELLLGVAVEIAFAAAGGALAFRARREGWLPHAASRSARPMIAVIVMCVMLGAAIDQWLPEANSLPQALRALRG